MLQLYSDIKDLPYLSLFTLEDKRIERIENQKLTEVTFIDSLNPAEIKKKLKTMYVIAIPGGSMVHQVIPPPTANRALDAW